MHLIQRTRLPRPDNPPLLNTSTLFNDNSTTPKHTTSISTTDSSSPNSYSPSPTSTHNFRIRLPHADNPPVLNNHTPFSTTILRHQSNIPLRFQLPTLHPRTSTTHHKPPSSDFSHNQSPHNGLPHNRPQQSPLLPPPTPTSHHHPHHHHQHHLPHKHLQPKPSTSSTTSPNSSTRVSLLNPPFSRPTQHNH